MGVMFLSPPIYTNFSGFMLIIIYEGEFLFSLEFSLLSGFINETRHGIIIYTMKVSDKKLTAVLRKQSLGRLLNEIKMVKSAADLDKFLGEIFTKDEKEIILRRIIVADMLERKLKYREIKKALSISHLTISKVRDMLAKRGYGRNPGRKRVYSSDIGRKRRRQKPLLGYYKGAASII